MRRMIGIGALLAAMPLAAHAQSNTFVPGTQFTTVGLTGFTTDGSLMSGMLVSWKFAGEAETSASWGDLGAGLYGVLGANGFRVSFGATTNTFGGVWTVQNSAQQRLEYVRFNGAPGRTLFDCDWTGSACSQVGSPFFEEGTQGSARGWSHESAGGSFTGNVFGEYANLVALTGNAPVGDLFEQLTITFGGTMGAGASYQFIADTDNSPFDAPPPTVVPEPSTYALLATGLAALAAVRRRRRTA